MEKEKNKEVLKPEYGDNNKLYKLNWHDESKRDYLIITDVQDKQAVMNQRAKGTTVYDLIKLYGGIDEVTEAFAGNEKTALYDDVSDYPEIANDDEYLALLNRIKNDLASVNKSTDNQSENKQNENKEVVNTSSGEDK